MVRNRGRGNPAHRDNFSAIHLLATANGLKDSQARLAGQGFGDFLDLRAVHIRTAPEPGRSLTNCSLHRQPEYSRIEKVQTGCNRILR